MLQNHSILLIAILTFSYFVTLFYKKWAVKKSIIDIPNERSSHTIPTPRGGGIAIIISFYIGLYLFYINNQVDKKLFLALLPGLILATTGIMDDLKGLSPMIRFIIQFICSGVSLYFLDGVHITIYNNLFWLWSIFALFGFVWFINLFNFLDGSDGYASMEAIFISISLWIFTKSNIPLMLAVSVCGFLFWNWPKAKIFMGDVGSTTLGFILIVFGVYFNNIGDFDFSMWILLTSLFWFDASITLLRRFLNKEKLSQPHKKHIYQRAIQGGLSHLMILLSSLLINIVILLICYYTWTNSYSNFIAFIIVMIIQIIILKYVDNKFAFNK